MNLEYQSFFVTEEVTNVITFLANVIIMCLIILLLWEPLKSNVKFFFQKTENTIKALFRFPSNIIKIIKREYNPRIDMSEEISKINQNNLKIQKDILEKNRKKREEW